MILIDSCVYISILRNKQDPAKSFARLSQEADLATCGVVRCEVLRGALSPKIHASLTAYLNCQIYLPTLNHVWEATERLTWEMDRKGLIIPLTDTIIAATALLANARVLTADRHFEKVPGLTVMNYPY